MIQWRCDQCGHVQDEQLPFEVEQRTDETDEDGETIVMVFHLCSAQCLSNLSMGLTLDFEAD